MTGQVASSPAESRVHALSLAVGLILMGAVTADPRLLASATGRPDHLLALMVAWAMTAGLVRGVGFIPRAGWIRRMLSGYACALVLICAGLVRVCQ
jgi:predicted membrane protein